MRVQITLTGEKAAEYTERKERLEKRLGYEMSHPEAFGMLMNPAVADKIISLPVKR
ncbi:hypothetical protein CWS96_gp24 [Saline Natrinema sp. J7-1 virus 1]|uniref:Uncharacterized protein n=1 Tax=Saline Natrinema sp. J7-1 virus 1 TaxID=2847285 RepID=A0AAE9VKV5_9VIRU|nr:hypothetical protein CWS96_gp24 [Saline Natrinema sp. J7-1 virus 1]WBE14028.1 hypothetical protein [Saline Natrinema sp. J7-1 virus 1]